MNGHTLYRSERLKDKNEFKALFQRGVRVKGKFLSIQVLKRNGVERKVAFIASKKVGNAVKRNRAKRLMREMYRCIRHDFPEKVDLAFIADRKILSCDIHELKDDMLRLAAQC